MGPLCLLEDVTRHIHGNVAIVEEHTVQRRYAEAPASMHVHVGHFFLTVYLI